MTTHENILRMVLKPTERKSPEEGAAEQFQHHWLGYTESQGSHTLRQAITTQYQSINEEEVLVHTGPKKRFLPL